MNTTLLSSHTPALRSPLAWLQKAMAFVPHASTASPVNQVHVLEAGDTIEVTQPLQHELVCMKGRLWITHDNMPADVVIDRGERYVAASDSRMLVHAIGDARLIVCSLRA